MPSFCENVGCCRNWGGRKSDFGARHPKIFSTQTQNLSKASQKNFRGNIDPHLTQSWPYVKISHFSTKNRLLAKLRWSKMRIRGAGGRKKFRPELQICISLPNQIFRSIRYLESDSWNFPGGNGRRSPPPGNEAPDLARSDVGWKFPIFFHKSKCIQKVNARSFKCILIFGKI